MQRNIITEAIVLKTYNVGEADRFCILLTKDFGRLHVRANGARKTGSKLGPYLLSGQCIEVQVRTSTTSSIVQSAQLLHSALHNPHTQTLHTIIECCMALLPEQEPVQSVYSIVQTYVSNPHKSVVAPLLQILNALGYIPSIYDPEIVQACTQKEHEVLRSIIEDNTHTIPIDCAIFEERLLRWARKKIEHESGKPLNSLQYILQ